MEEKSLPEGYIHKEFEKQTLNGTFKGYYNIISSNLEQVVVTFYNPERLGILVMLNGTINAEDIPPTTPSYTEIIKDFQNIVSEIAVEENVTVEYKIIKRPVDYGN